MSVSSSSRSSSASSSSSDSSSSSSSSLEVKLPPMAPELAKIGYPASYESLELFPLADGNTIIQIVKISYGKYELEAPSGFEHSDGTPIPRHMVERHYDLFIAYSCDLSSNTRTELCKLDPSRFIDFFHHHISASRIIFIYHHRTSRYGKSINLMSYNIINKEETKKENIIFDNDDHYTYSGCPPVYEIFQLHSNQLAIIKSNKMALVNPDKITSHVILCDSQLNITEQRLIPRHTTKPDDFNNFCNFLRTSYSNYSLTDILRYTPENNGEIKVSNLEGWKRNTHNNKLNILINSGLSDKVLPLPLVGLIAAFASFEHISCRDMDRGYSCNPVLIGQYITWLHDEVFSHLPTPSGIYNTFANDRWAYTAQEECKKSLTTLNSKLTQPAPDRHDFIRDLFNIFMLFRDSLDLRNEIENPALRDCRAYLKPRTPFLVQSDEKTSFYKKFNSFQLFQTIVDHDRNMRSSSSSSSSVSSSSVPPPRNPRGGPRS